MRNYSASTVFSTASDNIMKLVFTSSSTPIGRGWQAKFYSEEPAHDNLRTLENDSDSPLLRDLKIDRIISMWSWREEIIKVVIS